jgi:iron complex outermembrane receptor protein
MMRKGVALFSSSLLAVAFSQAALAQSANDDQSENDRSNANVILVTGTKIATDVQDVPIAITAVTSETLEAQQIVTMSDLGNIVPNATFRKSQGVYGAGVQVNLRGLGTTNTQFSSEPSVSYYIDDVYYPFLFGSNFDLLDLERVEVLRGPQGTLFGRNAIAGAINLVSRRPSLTEASAYIDLTVGSYNRNDLRAGFNLPLADNLALSVSAASKKRDGYVDLLDFSCEMHRRGTPELAGTFPFASDATTYSVTAGRTPKSCKFDAFGGEDQQAVRGSVYWEPTPSISVQITGDYMDANDQSAPEVIEFVDYDETYGLQPDGTVDESDADQDFIYSFDAFSIPGTPFRWDERFETGDIYTSYETMCDPFPAGTDLPEGPALRYYNGSLFRGGNCNEKRQVPVTNWGVSGKVIVDLTENLEATAIAGYREIDTVFTAGWDGTPLADSVIFHEDHMSYWTGELRLAGQFDWLDFVGGLFYYDGKADEFGRPQNVRVGSQRFQTVLYRPEAKAAYLNVTVRPYEAFGILEGLSFNGGIRRSDDSKGVDYASLNDATPPGETVFVPSGTSTTFLLDIRNKRWDWKLGLDYQFADDALVYASAATGYRLPGFGTRLFQDGQQEQQVPTVLINYEIGFKVDLFNRRLRLNGAAFLQDYSSRNAVFGGLEPTLAPDGVSIVPGDQTLIPDGPEGTPFANAFTNCRDYDPVSDGPPNGATVGIDCIVRQFNYSAAGGEQIKGIELEAFAEPIDNLNLNLSVGYTDRGSETGRPVGFPDWTGSGGISYTIEEVLGGSLTPRLDLYYVGKIAYSTNITRTDDEARVTANGRITYVNYDHDYEVALGVTNLFDKKYFRQKIAFSSFATVDIGQPAPPREWYLQVKKRF